MRFLFLKALVYVSSAICMSTVLVGAANADSVTYVYRGNNFVQIDGDPTIFSTKNRVTGRFTIDCSVAHPEGNCVNLPFNNYLALGAVRFESLRFSAGPATLPTNEGFADVNMFYFSTDANGQILDWNIDLSLFDPSGIINVDTDNNFGGPIDSAAAMGGGAVVFDNPGEWKTIGSPRRRSASMFKDHSRTYGNDVGANVCFNFGSGERCADLYVWEHYDVHGTFQHTGLSLYYWFHRFYPEGGWIQGSRWMSCELGPDAIKAHQNSVSLSVTVNPSEPECFVDGYVEECDYLFNCTWRPSGFPDGTIIAGDWIKPLNTSKVVVNQSDSFYDPWLDRTFKSSVHCNETAGHMMADGGFVLQTGARVRDFWFDGFDTQGWSHYWLRSCNNRQEEK